MISALVNAWFGRVYARSEAAIKPRRVDYQRDRFVKSNTNNDVSAPFSSDNIDLKLTLHRSIREIPDGEWDAIIGRNGLFRSHAYFSAIEKTQVNQSEYFYPVIRNQSGEIVAHACICLIDTDLGQLFPKPLFTVLHSARRLWPRLMITRITECASPLSTSHSISVAPSVDRQLILRLLDEAMSSLAREKRSRIIVVRDFLLEDRRAYDGFLQEGFNLVSNMPLARIRVRWATYDEYLSSMRSRYRKDVKRRLRKACQAGQSVQVLRNFGEEADTWVAQAKTVQHSTKGFKREILPQAYYRNMDKMLGAKSMLVTAVREGRAVAHGMVLNDDTTSVATYFGRDAGPAHNEWFSLVNEVIRIGIEHKSEYINLGLGSYDAKSNVGADVEPLFVYTKSTSIVINWIMRLIPRTMDRDTGEAKKVFHE